MTSKHIITLEEVENGYIMTSSYSFNGEEEEIAVYIADELEQLLTLVVHEMGGSSMAKSPYDYVCRIVDKDGEELEP